MVRQWIITLMVSLLLGCSGKTGRMEQPEDPQGRYAQQIAVAQRVLERKEKWTKAVEWEVVKTVNGWKVTAWRVEHPEKKGPSRYLPWGYSVIELDSRMVAVGYRRGG